MTLTRAGAATALALCALATSTAAAEAARMNPASAVTFLAPFSLATQGDEAKFDDRLAPFLIAEVCQRGTSTCTTITSRANDGSVLRRNGRAYVLEWKAQYRPPAKPFLITVRMRGSETGKALELGSRAFCIASPAAGQSPRIACRGARRPVIGGRPGRTVSLSLSVDRHPVIRARHLALTGTAPAGTARRLREEFGASPTQLADALAAAYEINGVEVAAVLRRDLGMDAEDVAVALREGVELSLADAAVALKDGASIAPRGMVRPLALAYRASPDALAKLLIAPPISAGPDDVAAGLLGDLRLSPPRVARALRGASVADDVIAIALTRAGAELVDVYRALRALGLTLGQAASILDSQVKASPQAILTALRRAGERASEAVNANVGPLRSRDFGEAVRLMHQAGYPPPEIMRALVGFFGFRGLPGDSTAARLARTQAVQAANATFEAPQVWPAVAAGIPELTPQAFLDYLGDVPVRRAIRVGRPAFPGDDGLQHLAHVLIELGRRVTFDLSKRTAAQNKVDPSGILGLMRGEFKLDIFNYTAAARRTVYGLTPYDLVDAFKAEYKGTLWRDGVIALRQRPGYPPDEIARAMQLDQPGAVDVAIGLTCTVEQAFSCNRVKEHLSGAAVVSALLGGRTSRVYTIEATAQGLDAAQMSFATIVKELKPYMQVHVEGRMKALGSVDTKHHSYRRIRSQLVLKMAAQVLDLVVRKRVKRTTGFLGLIEYVGGKSGREDIPAALRKALDPRAVDMAYAFREGLGYNEVRVGEALHRAGYAGRLIGKAILRVFPPERDPEDEEDRVNRTAVVLIGNDGGFDVGRRVRQLPGKALDTYVTGFGAYAGIECTVSEPTTGKFCKQ